MPHGWEIDGVPPGWESDDAPHEQASGIAGTVRVMKESDIVWGLQWVSLSVEGKRRLFLQLEGG